MKANLYVCRKMRLCSYLLNHGFMYEREDVNINNPTKKVWLFKDNDKLRNAIEDYYNREEFLNRKID